MQAQRVHRGAAVRQVRLEEPELYKRQQLMISCPDGTVDFKRLVPKCPVALGMVDCEEPCIVVRIGFATRHGVITNGFPMAVSGVQRLKCHTHGKSFNMLHPAIYEGLPDDAVVQPELVVLTGDTILLKEAYIAFSYQVHNDFPLVFWNIICEPFSCDAPHQACFDADSKSVVAGAGLWQLQ